MAAKPIPREFHNAILNAIRYGKKYVELLNYKFIRVQSIELAYLIYTQREFKNIKKLRVVITADDKDKHKEAYNMLSKNNKVEFIEYDTDTEVEMEYKNMEYKPDLDIMNPPYDGSLHLTILENVLANKKPHSTVISVQPVRWLEDPLAEYKQGTDYKKYKTSIVNKLSNIALIDVMTANNSFGITADQDLAIYTFGHTANEVYIYSKIVKTILAKIKTKNLPACSKFIEHEKVDGWRCETFKVKSLGQATTVKNSSNTYTSEGWEFMISGDKGYYHDGMGADGRWWTENRQATQNTRKVGEPFAQSFYFKTETGCANFYKSTHTLFYINLVYMLKTDMNLTPVLNHLPYMNDYETHAWTDEDYCKFFDLTKEESEFMCRKVEDYRIKDFINYINLED